MAVCAFPVSAFAASESAVTYSARINYGWFGDNEHFFNSLGTIYRIPHGIDGIFGGDARNAVMYYQGRKGLRTDGDIGDQTWTSFVNQGVFG